MLSAIKDDIKDRIQFKSLLLQNPNYFGNIPDSKYKPIKVIKNDTRYEELTCIAFNPDLNLIEATIAIKRPLGYGGGLCYTGSYEFVRFFIDYGNGWVDEGISSVNIHDIPNKKDCAQQNDKPLNYVVSLQIDPKKRRCTYPYLPKVHAVLSWNVHPPVTVGIPPVWGNSIECNIQIKPRKPIILDIFNDAKIKIPSDYEAASDIPIPIPDPPPLTLFDLNKLYQVKSSVENKNSKAEQTKVESHRFGFSVLKSMLMSNTFEEKMITNYAQDWKSFGIDLQKAVSILEKTKANVDYEEIECVGLNYDKDMLSASFKIKRPYGYLGSLCKQGSFEHIAFWVDWNNECKWTYLGTVSVNVHDLEDVEPKFPPGGVCYCAILPVSLDSIVESCEIPKIARIRAILSWNEMPSAVDPDDLKHWGNRIDTHVQVRPRISIPPGDHIPFIQSVGRMAVCKIDQATGLASGDSIGSIFHVNESPFGGKIEIAGILVPPIHYLPGSPRLKYRVSVRKGNAGSWQVLNNSFWVTIHEWVGPIPIMYSKEQVAPDGWFDYLVDHGPSRWRYVLGDTLAIWRTDKSFDDGEWEIMIEAKDEATGGYWTSIPTECTDGQFSGQWINNVKIYLDNSEPEAQIEIDLLSDGDYIGSGGTVPTTPAGECGDFTIGKYIIGRFKATDKSHTLLAAPHFRSYILSVLPTDIGGVPTPQTFSHKPVTTSYPSIPSSGISLLPPPSPTFSSPLPDGIWQLNTAGFKPCGYVIELWVTDRTNWNSGGYSTFIRDTIGFCMKSSS